MEHGGGLLRGLVIGTMLMIQVLPISAENSRQAASKYKIHLQVMAMT